jgi:hypothetical protein
MRNKVKTMQDKTPADIRCSACAKIIVPAHRTESYRERDLQEIISRHKCSLAGHSKRDFEETKEEEEE